MRIMYLRPAIVNASTLELASISGEEGILPVVVAAAEGYAAGKLLKKMIGANPAKMLSGLVKRKDYKE